MSGNMYGYARVSSKDQNLDRQLDALAEFGVEADMVFADKKSRIGKLIAIIISATLVFSYTPIVKPSVAMAASGSSKPTISATRAATGKVTVKKGATYNLGVKSAGAKLTYKSSKPSVLKSIGKGKFKR